jgi:dTDP-4-amino-4,6-dideoxygalactose transaminase
MKVPFSHLDGQFEDPSEIFDKIKDLVKSGKFTMGPHLFQFEQNFAKKMEANHAIGVGSGTDALFLSLKTIDIQPGDEVITAVNTFVATAGAIATAGGKIVFVDCNEKYVMDEKLLEASITSRTKAIMPVHYTGEPVNMTRVMGIAKKHKLVVIEDACHAIGSRFNGQMCGTFGDFAGYSLHPLKILNVWGDGGIILTSSDEYNEKLRLLRNHGMINRNEYVLYGYNSRLDTLQAIVADHLLSELDFIVDRRIEVAKRYDAGLQDLKDFITIPPRESHVKHAFHLYVLLVKDRDQLCAFLQENGVISKIHYPIPLHLQKASDSLNYKKGDFPIAEAQADLMLTLPCHQYLKDEEVDYTIEQIKRFYLN